MSAAAAGPARPRTKLLLNQGIWRVCFWMYAVVMFTATHWPRLEFQVPGVERPDLILHFGAFGAWTALFMLTEYAGVFGTKRHFLCSALIAAAYAGFDEGLQAFPIVQRNCAWDDFFANLGGVAIGGCLALVGGMVLCWMRGKEGRQ